MSLPPRKVLVYLITLTGLRCYDLLSLVHSIYDSTEEEKEEIIQRTIQWIQRMISLHNIEWEIEKEKGITTTKEALIEISLAAKKHWELEIKILRDAPRDHEKLREILKAKQKEYEKAEDSEDIEILIPEIEMLKFVLCLVSPK